MPAISPDMLVDDVMHLWPATLRVFLDHRFTCIGCPVTCFHTVEDACREHRADLSAFLGDLNAAAEERGVAALQPAERARP